MIQFGIALVILIAISVFWRYSAMVITGILCSKGYEASSANYFFSFLWDWSVFQKFDELIDSETSVKDVKRYRVVRMVIRVTGAMLVPALVFFIYSFLRVTR